MTTIADEIAGLPAFPLNSGHRPHGTIDAYRARLSLYQRAVREYLRAVDAYRARDASSALFDKMSYAEDNLRLVAKEVA